MNVQDELIVKMTVSQKIKAIDNIIEQNKAQYNLDRPAANILALSSGNNSKYKFLTGKYVLTEEDLLEKAAAPKRFEYLPSGGELKKQTIAAEKQDKELNNFFESDKRKNQQQLKNNKSKKLTDQN